MSAVVGKIASRIDQLVAFTQRRTVGPEIRSPQQQRSFDVALFSIKIQSGFAVDLILNQPPRGKCRFIGIRLGIQTVRGITAVDAARQICNPKVWKACLRVLNDGQCVQLQLPTVFFKVAARSLRGTSRFLPASSQARRVEPGPR